MCLSRHLPITLTRRILVVLLLVIALQPCLRAADPITDQVTNLAAKGGDYVFEDRGLWFQLKQKEFELGGESLSFSAARFYPPEQRPKTLYLFIGETAEPNNGDAIVVERLTELSGASVWYLDTPDALFMERSRGALRQLDGAFMTTLMDGLGRWFDEVIVISMDVAGVPVLRGLRAWQTRASDEQRELLSQVVLLFPSLYVNTPVAGEERELFPIVENTALPITIFQPELGAQSNTIDWTIKALQRGGSLVQLRRLENTIDGIFKFQDIRERAEAFPAQLLAAVADMRERRRKLKYPIYALSPVEIEVPKSNLVSGLKQIKTPYPMPAIKLTSFEGEMIDVAQAHKGKAMLINFWATWCPHCVEEIPSMNRAKWLLADQPFEMVSVSYRDTQAIMEKFLSEIPVDFPVLMDFDGEESARWKVFAFPSSFLVDKQGRVRYSINAGAIWDDPELVEVMRTLANEPDE